MIVIFKKCIEHQKGIWSQKDQEAETFIPIQNYRNHSEFDI